VPSAARLLACALLALSGTAHAAGDWTLERLLRGFAERGAAHASFIEKKTVRVLDAPLVSSGELNFVPPDRLDKRTLRPRTERLQLDGERLTLERAGRVISLNLRSHPEAAAFVEGIRGTLAGDLGALERHYRLRLEGESASWALTLVPRDAAMASLVTRVRIAGRRADISVIEIQHANGDVTLMSVLRRPTP